MHWIRRAALIAFMLFGFVALLVGLSTPVLAEIPSQTFAPQLPAESTPSGEFCGGNTGFACSASTPQPVKGKQVGKIEGERAGQDDPVGTNRPCLGVKGSEYCDAWEAAYAAAQAAKAQQQRGGGISPADILKVVGIIVAVGIIVWMGAALAGVEIATTAVKVVARFFSGNKP